MILRDAKAIKLGTTTINKVYSGTYKVYDKNKTALEGYCVQNGEPTPDNPIEIETMKGRQIIPIEKINIISTDVNDWEGGQYGLNGEKQAINSRIRMKELVPIEPGNVYYFNTFTKEYNIILRTYNENKTFISSIGNVTNDTTITVTTARYISVTLWKNGDSSISYTELLQKISDKEITPYICLNSAKYVVDLKSKNLWGGKTFTTSNNNVNYTINSDGTITANGTASSNSVSGMVAQYNNAKMYKTLNAGTYTISKNSNKIQLQVYDTSSGFIKALPTTQNSDNFTLSDTTDIIVRIMIPSGISVNETFTFQLEEGSTPTTYEPYYDYELAGIDEYKDSIYTKEGKWYVHKGTEKVILDGSESGWENANTNLFNVANILPRHLTTQDINAIKTTYYYGGLTKDTNQKFLASVLNYNYACGLHTNGTTIRFKDTRYTDKTQLQTWLASNNVILYYVLNTPTEEEITAPGLIAQLNVLYQAM